MLHTVIRPQIAPNQADEAWAARPVAEVAGRADRAAPSFTRPEWDAIRLGLSDCEQPVARGGRAAPIARAIDWTLENLVGLRGGRALADPRLDALRRFTAATRRQRGAIGRDELALFVRAGFTRHHADAIAASVTVADAGSRFGHDATRTMAGRCGDADRR